MPSIADRVRETTTTTGTGTVNLEGAVTGFQSFSAAFSTGAVVYYCITDGTNWEIGYGAVTTGSPWTLARSTILQSSNADALVNFAAGAKDVFCTMPAQALIGSGWLIKTTTYTAVNGDRIAADTSGGAFTITLPATPTTGHYVEITDGGGAFATNNLTIARNGSTLMGLSEDMVVSTNNIGFGLIYTGTTWRLF